MNEWDNFIGSWVEQISSQNGSTCSYCRDMCSPNTQQWKRKEASVRIKGTIMLKDKMNIFTDESMNTNRWQWGGWSCESLSAKKKKRERKPEGQFQRGKYRFKMITEDRSAEHGLTAWNDAWALGSPYSPRNLK